jgi:hypothetical protein
MNIVEWIVSEKLAVNNFAAAHIANGLKCAGLPEDEQKRRVEEYRKWRRATKDKPAQCYQYVLDGKQAPDEMFDEGREPDDSETDYAYMAIHQIGGGFTE